MRYIEHLPRRKEYSPRQDKIRNGHDRKSSLDIILERLPQNLAARALGDLFHDLEAALDPLEPRLLLPHVPLQLLPDHLLVVPVPIPIPVPVAVFQNDKRLGHLPAVVVRDADDGDVGHAVVAEEAVLQLGGRDGDAFDLDHLLDAVVDADEAVRVDGAEVARAQPAAVEGERVPRRGLVAQVAHDDLRAPGQDLAGLAGARVLAGVRADAEDRVGEDLSDGGGVLEVVQVGREAREAARRLGHAVAVLEARAGELGREGFEDLVADGGGAGAEALDAGEVVGRHEGVVQEADEEGRDDEELFDLVGRDGAEHGGHGEAGEHDGFGVEEDGEVERVDEAADVVEGEDGEGLFLGRWSDLLGLKDLGDDVVVGYHDLMDG